ncbi:hypothetical protein WKR98_13300 [Pigmentiphaga sp. YJ18]|uniref:hypothetical protein n=1 Tax=Pigmentiphaga sp. YJ18 TaxID=3134907 RepID=UPI003117F402
MNHRDFTAPYVFQEFPKWVTLADGSQILVENAEEEAIVTEGKKEDDAPDPERDVLLARAKELGLKVHPATGLDKLREKIAAAQG